MRIAVLVESFPRISESFVVSQITGLIDLGHRVEIVARRPSDEDIEHPDVERYRLRERLHLLRPPVPNPAAPHDEMERRALASLCREREFDLVFAHFGPNGELAARVKQQGFGWPLLTMFHGYDLRWGLTRGPAIYATLFGVGDGFLAVCGIATEELVALGAPRERVRVHPAGIDPSRFRVERPAAQPDEDAQRPIVAITVARLHPVKGHEHAIRAFRLLRDRRSELSLEYRLVGAGPAEAFLRALVAELGLDETIHFLGARDERGVRDELARADLFVLPSLAEGLPVAVMEAQAAELPVVASAVGGMAELVQEGRSGHLVAPRDSLALADRIERLAGSPDIRRRQGRDGRRDVERRYDVRKLNRALDRICHELRTNAPDGRATSRYASRRRPRPDSAHLE